MNECQSHSENNSSDTSYQSDSSGSYWQVRSAILYAGNNSAAPTTNSIQKTRLTGLGVSSGSCLLTSESCSFDLLGNSTISRTYVDRADKTVTQVVNYPDSTNAATQITINGQLITSLSKTATRTDYCYDPLGRQICASTGGGLRSVATTSQYNDKGQVASTMDAASNCTTYTYDSLGRTIATTDALSNTTHTAYDAEGRVTNTWGATYPVAYGYDAFGRMASMRTYRTEGGAGDETKWFYDQATGLLTNKVYADTNGTAYTYTPDGKLATRGREGSSLHKRQTAVTGSGCKLQISRWAFLAETR